MIETVWFVLGLWFIVAAMYWLDQRSAMEGQARMLRTLEEAVEADDLRVVVMTPELAHSTPKVTDSRRLVGQEVILGSGYSEVFLVGPFHAYPELAASLKGRGRSSVVPDGSD